MFKPALIFIYNHCHPENIDPLNKIYGKRFPHIYHLVPFYKGKKRDNVIPVYDNSFYFHGFIPQGLRDYYREEYTHYIFLADDYLLNPRINAENFLEWFGLSSQPRGACFISDQLSNIGRRFNNYRAMAWAYNYSLHTPGLKVHKELPSFEEALSRFQELGLDTRFFKKPKSHKTSFYYDHGFWSFPYDAYHKAIQFVNKPTRGKKILGRHWSRYLHPWYIFYSVKNRFKPYTMSYPLVTVNFADALVIPGNQMKQFAQYCAFFAASNLYTDISITTAMVLLGSPIICGNVSRLSYSEVKELKQDIKIKHVLPMPTLIAMNDNLPAKYNHHINDLLDDYSPNFLGIHPIKLSKWEI